MQLHDQLDSLISLLRQQGSELDRNPPLTADQVHAILATVHLPPIPEIVALYTWANGTARSSDPLFRDEQCIPLEVGFEERATWTDETWFDEAMREWQLDPKNLILFGEWYGHFYGLYYGTVGLLSNPILGFGDTIGISYKDMSAMIQTCIAWVQQGEWGVCPMRGQTWYTYNQVAGDPTYIETLMRQLDDEWRHASS